jgi:hypothetical protein
MSLLDQVRKLEQQVVERLKELEPLTREYEQLRKVAERLGIKYSPRSADSDAKPSTAASRGGSRATTRARSGRSAAKSTTARPRAAKTAAKPRGARSARRKPAASSTQAGGAAASAKATPASARKRAGAARARSGARRATAARPGQRNDDVLRLVEENPGITVREISERLGVDPTGLYRVAKRLTDDGRVRKDGTRLYPVESATASPPTPEAASAGQTTPESGPPPPGATAPAEPESPTTDADTASSDDK